MNEVTSAVEDTLINIFLFQTTEAFLRDKTARVEKLKADNPDTQISIKAQELLKRIREL